MSIYNVAEFGALADGTTDDWPAFQAALNKFDADSMAAPDLDDKSHRGGVLYVPAGKYWLSDSLVIKRCIVIQGEGMLTSRLVFGRDTPVDAEQLAGIIVRRENSLTPGNPAPTGESTEIRGISIENRTGNYSRSGKHPPAPLTFDEARADGSSFSGVVVLVPFVSIQNCQVLGFLDDGIHINSDPEHADSWRIDTCRLSQNGRHGLFVIGSEANVGTAVNLTCNDNCQWGLCDHSGVGNVYVNCNVESNGIVFPGTGDPNEGGAYLTSSGFARHIFLGCYSEGDQNPSQFRWPTMVLGGLHEAGLRQTNSTNDVTYISNEGYAQVSGPFATMSAFVNTPTFDIASRLQSVFLIDASIQAVDINLPPLNDPAVFHGFRGNLYTIKKIDHTLNHVNVHGFSPTDTIDGSNPYVLADKHSFITVIGDESGSGWHIIGRG